MEENQLREEAALKGLPEERAVLLAEYIVRYGATVPQTAARFGVSKSAVHGEAIR